MIKVYIINLDLRPDRLQHVCGEFARVGVPFERVQAVDAKTSDLVRGRAKRAQSQFGVAINDAALACLLSHRRAWQTFLESEEPYCAVFEDDVLLSDSIPRFVQSDWIPKDADIVKLETFVNRTHVEARPELNIENYDLCRLRSRHVGSAAYIMSRHAAQSLLNSSAPLVDAVDEIMFNEKFGWMPGATVYQVVPAVAIQADRMDSEIGTQEDWVKGSIPQRSALVDKISRETVIGRVVRRASNEIRARLTGTQYKTIPFDR